MSYTITNVQKKTAKSGKEFIKCVIGDKETVIFSTFPDFANLAENSVVDGDLSKGEPYNGKDQYTLWPLKKQYVPRGNGGSAGMKAAVEAKNTNINKAIDRKEESIKLAGLQRDAVLLVTTFYVEEASTYHNTADKEEFIREKIAYWKKTLDQSYGDGQPFKD